LVGAAYVSQIQKLKVKDQNDNSKRKNVVRGFSLVPGQDRTTLKGRTTILFGISPTALLLKTEEFDFCFVILLCVFTFSIFTFAFDV
jgi:hypothetical protein